MQPTSNLNLAQPNLQLVSGAPEPCGQSTLTTDGTGGTGRPDVFSRGEAQGGESVRLQKESKSGDEGAGTETHSPATVSQPEFSVPDGLHSASASGIVRLRGDSPTTRAQVVSSSGGIPLLNASAPKLELFEAYESKLTTWVESATRHARTAHQQVRSIIHGYLAAPEQGGWRIDLSERGLSTLPPLPADLKILIARNNNLSMIPAHLLPDLLELDICGNQLSTLPANLPASLRKLDVSSNQLSMLPANLPTGLLELHVCFNQLSTLPANLPLGLLELQASGNQLNTLPVNLPPGLLRLFVNDNNLSTLPAHLPRGLLHVDIWGNQFSAEALIALMQTNTSITRLDLDQTNLDPASQNIIAEELEYNKAQSERLAKAAAVFDLLVRFALMNSDHAGTLITRPPTVHSVSGTLPEQPIPQEIHTVLAANTPKDILKVLVGMAEDSHRSS